MGIKLGGNMATLNNEIYISVIVTLPFVITCLHFWLSEGHAPPMVLEEIYYTPLFLGILRFGKTYSTGHSRGGSHGPYEQSISFLQNKGPRQRAHGTRG
jgi:hypothetical protein